MIHFVIEDTVLGASRNLIVVVVVVVYVLRCVRTRSSEYDHPVLRFGYPTMRGLNQSRVSKTPVTRTRRACGAA